MDDLSQSDSKNPYMAASSYCNERRHPSPASTSPTLGTYARELPMPLPIRQQPRPMMDAPASNHVPHDAYRSASEKRASNPPTETYRESYAAYPHPFEPQRAYVPNDGPSDWRAASPSSFPPSYDETMYPKTAPFRDSRSPQRTGSEPTDADVLTQALEFTRRPPPPLGSIPPLRRPIAIPQVTGGIGQPYIRAWAPELESHGISEKEFVEFVDNLNVVTTSNPPLQVLDLVGGVIGFVPYHWAMIAGIAIQATAKLGKAAVSKGRTEMYMTKVNTAFFAPRRLQARIASGDAMAAALHLPPSMPLLAPLTQQNIHMTSQERVIAAVQPYMSFVTLNVPPPTSQTTMLAKMSAKQVEIQTKRREHKVMKQRMKHGIPGSADGPRNGNWSEKMMRLDEKAVEIEQQGGLDHRQQRKLDKLDRKMDKLERKSERKSGKGDKKDKEAKGAQKSLWILIENLD